MYRLNFGVSKNAFLSLFGAIPRRPPAGGLVDTGHDFTRLNKIMPHPVYGWMCRFGVLNPCLDTFERLKPMIDEAVGAAEQKLETRVRNRDLKTAR